MSSWVEFLLVFFVRELVVTLCVVLGSGGPCTHTHKFNKILANHGILGIARKPLTK